MIEISTEFDEEIPKWDVALEALIREEYRKLGRAVGIEDYRRLAAQYAIRFDDIMVTVFELTVHGEWEYLDAQGRARPITREAVERLYVNGRLDADDVRAYSGGWRPAGPPSGA